MVTEPITIQVDVEAADAYKRASAEEQKKMQVLLSLRLKEIATADAVSLAQLMNEISSNAQARGLTDEEVESIPEV
ncbi:MAG: hypothetical protein WBP93_13290 [Pyrinomonadaceae bacterium]